MNAITRLAEALRYVDRNRKIGDESSQFIALIVAAREVLAEQAAPAQAPKGEPIGWVFQHEETGRMAFCENDGINTPEVFQRINPRHVLCSAAYAEAPAQAPADPLSQEALLRRIAELQAVSAQGYAQVVEALRQISLCSQSSASSKDECGRIARAALRAIEGEKP